MTTEEQLEAFKKNLDDSLRAQRLAAAEQQQARRIDDSGHIAAAIAAKIDPQLKAEDASAAKAYSRARSFMMLRKAYDVAEEYLSDADIPAGKKLPVAMAMIQRAVGAPKVPSVVKADFSQMAPVDVIDYVLREHAAGNVTREFVHITLNLLRAKVQGLKLEGMIQRALEQVDNGKGSAGAGS